MAELVMEPGKVLMPGEVLEPENGSKFEKFMPDGVYEYAMKPNGKPDKSHVRITYNDGDIFEGTLRRGKYVGIGKYIWKDGGQYEGNFVRGKMTGKGKYISSTGDVFEGEFKKNKYVGNGKYTWADGSTFEGTFKKGLIMSGKFTDVSGNVYSCSFTYKRNGERKAGTMRLIKSAQKKEEHKEKKPAEKTVSKTAKKKQNANGLLSKDITLLSSIKKSARGAEFKNLYSGAAGKDEKSEKSLIAILDFFTNSDAEQIQRIYKSSKLYDAMRSQEHVTTMIDGVIKDRKEFTKALKDTTKGKQAVAGAAKGAAR